MVVNEITYTEVSTNIVYVTARDIKPRDLVVVTVTADPITLTTTLDAITSTATETIPPYATSACLNHSAYVEACRSHLSVVEATITITAPTSYVTEYTTVSLPGGLSGGSLSASVSNVVGSITLSSSSVGGITSSSSSNIGVESTSTHGTYPYLHSNYCTNQH